MGHRYVAVMLAGVFSAWLLAPWPAEAATGAERTSEASQVSDTPPDSVTSSSVLLANGSTITFTATAGLLTVGATDEQDAKLGLDGTYRPGTQPNLPADPAHRPATAQMFYTAYIAKATDAATRPIMFIYDGGPGSASRGLLMGSFGPVLVKLPQLQHPADGPYTIVNNPDSLLDAADLVFIDAPGTGFGSIQGRDAAAAFYGIDGDAAAFARFVQRFLTRFDRWSSPKYLFGHSYGTMRNAALGWQLLQDGVDLNGIVSSNQWLSQNDFLDYGPADPGTDNPYFLALPSFAAIAWYHHTVAHRPAALEPWLAEVERYALTDYAGALLAGSDLAGPDKQRVAEKLESYTGIPAATWVRANLRITGGQFEKMLLADRGLTIGRLDARYTGPSINALSAAAEYDPFEEAIGSAVTAAMNVYARDTLKFGKDLSYQADADVPDLKWNTDHVTTGKAWQGAFNTLPDLADMLKHNPGMHVLVTGGYYDLSTTFFASIYEMKHLPVAAPLAGNIEFAFFETGHEPYVSDDARRKMHDGIVRFIEASRRKG